MTKLFIERISSISTELGFTGINSLISFEILPSSKLRTSKILIDEFRSGKLGKITLELPEDISEMAKQIKEKQREKKQNDYKRKQEYKKNNPQ